MMNTAVKIKVCGLRRVCDADYVNEVKPDYVGFVFANGRRRCISLNQALQLRERLDESIISVGVFVDESEENIVKIAESGAIRMLQLHGNESDSFVSMIKAKTSLPVIKAFTVNSEEDIEIACRSSADYILLDNGKGGTGENFNWSLINDVKRDFFLAGGLNSENVSAAIKKLKPFAVDVSSAVETDGFKDYNKIKEFVEKVRSF